MMKQIFLVLILATGMASCCKHEKLPQNLCAEPQIENASCITDTSQIKILLPGKWNWTQSVNSWTMAKTNPCTDSINFSYEFFSNGTAKYFENGTYKYPGTYSFSQSQGMSVQLFYDSAYHYHESGWVSVCNNHLIIDDSPVDGPKDIFVKAE